MTGTLKIDGWDKLVQRVSDLEDIVDTLNTTLVRVAECPDCHGAGGDAVDECSTCKGNGKRFADLPDSWDFSRKPPKGLT